MRPLDFRRLSVPGFVATTVDPVAEPFTAERRQVQTYGPWSDDELIDITCPAARLLVLGHCLTHRAVVEAEFSQVSGTGRINFLDDLPGAYAYLVIWRSGALTARGDDAGQYPLYYSCAIGETVVGMHPGVLGHLHRRQPDATTAAIRIACPNVLPLDAGRSVFQGVRAVEPGASLHAVAGEVRVDRGDPAPQPRLRRGDAADALRTQLVRAVQGRTSGAPMSCDLSGGLDSTSLAFLAAHHSRSPVHALTYRHPSAPAQDFAYAAQYAEFDARIRHSVVIGTEDSLPYRHLSGAVVDEVDGGEAVTDEPVGAMVARPRSEARLAAAVASGSRLHLTGEGGDAVFGSPPVYLADLAATVSAAALYRLCARQALIREESPWRLLRRARTTAGRSAAASLTQLAAQLQKPRVRPMQWSDCVSWWPVSGEAVDWLTPAMRTTMADIAGDPRTTRTVPADMTASDVQIDAEVRNSAATQRYLRELGSRIGVAVHAPYLDNPIVRICARVRAAERFDPEISKPVLGAALAGLVPAVVFERTSKGSYSGEDHLGARRTEHHLRRLIDDSRLADLGVVEPQRVMRSIERLCAGITAPVGALNQLLAFEVWLRGQEHRYHDAERGSHVHGSGS